MSSFEDIANTPIEEIKDVPPLPPGTYLAMISGPHEMVKSGQKQTDGMQFNLKMLQAREDVDRDALDAALNGRPINDVVLRHTIWESPFAATAVRDLLKDVLGLEGTVKAALAEVPGRQLYVNLVHRPFQDRSGNMRIRAEIGSLARAE